MPMSALVAVAIAVTLFAGCASSPPDHFYTLSGSADAKAATAIDATAPYYIEVASVDVPEQVARPQLVIGSGPGQVELKEHQRWAAPLDSEIRHALSEELTAQLGALDIYRTAHSAGVPVYQIGVKVKRFESMLGSHALINTLWSVRAAAGETVLTCQSSKYESIAATGEKGETAYTALAAAHRRALARLAADMAATVRALAALPASAPPAQIPACPNAAARGQASQ